MRRRRFVRRDGPLKNSQSTTQHLVTQLEAAGLTWRSYHEDISGTDCPLTSVNKYVLGDAANTNDLSDLFTALP